MKANFVDQDHALLLSQIAAANLAVPCASKYIFLK